MMNEKIRIVLALVLLFGSALTAQAQNGLANGNFEADTASPPTGWNSFSTGALTVEAAGAYEGAQCGKVIVAPGKDQLTNGSFVQYRVWGPMNIRDKKLRLSGWVKTQYGAGGTPSVTLAKAEKVANAFPIPNIKFLDNRAGELATWTYLVGGFTVEVGPTSDPGGTPNTDFLAARLYLNTMDVTGDSAVYLDDFQLTEQTVDATNVLTNPGFELGTSGWEMFPPSSFTRSVTSESPKEGSLALKAVYAAGGAGQLYQFYNGPEFYTGSRMMWSAWVKANYPSAGGWVALSRDIAINDAWGNYYGITARLDGEVANWTKMEGELLLPVGPAKGTPAPATDYLALRLHCEATAVTGGESTVYWDDVKLVGNVVPVELSSFDIE